MFFFSSFSQRTNTPIYIITCTIKNESTKSTCTVSSTLRFCSNSPCAFLSLHSSLTTAFSSNIIVDTTELNNKNRTIKTNPHFERNKRMRQIKTEQ